MKKIFGLIILILIMCTGCSPFDKVETVPVEETEPEQEKLIHVGFSQLGSESLWREANTESIKQALTLEKGFQLELTNARQRQDNQIKAIRNFISQGMDYIVFSPVTEEGWETVLGEARDAGIPVILVDRKISTSDDTLYTTWVGSDARQEGEKAGRWLEEHMNSVRFGNTRPINIVVLQGNIGSSAQLGRTMGFDSIADQHKNWHILEQQSADFTTAKAKEVMNRFLNKYEDIDVVVCQNDDMAFGAIESIEKAGYSCGLNSDMVMISFDAVKEGLLRVSQGQINVDIECNPLEGEYVAEIIQKLERGESVEKSYVVDEEIFTIDNVNEVLSERVY